jgi:protease I
MTLEGRRIALIIGEGHHEHELWCPWYRFQEEGAEVIAAGPRVGIVLGEGRNGKDGLAARVTHTVEQVAGLALDALYLPGGLWSPMTLRVHEPTLDLVRTCMAQGIVVGAICHASWILVSAGVARGKRIACPRDMAVDVTNAGGLYVEDRCVRDGNLVTAVYYACLPQHMREIIPAIAASPRRGDG